MEIIVGKQGEQPFAITDKNVSRRHVKITSLDDGKYQIEDLNSTNGTFVDGVRVIKKVVTKDTIVQLGSNYTFKVGDAVGKQGAESRVQSSSGIKQTAETPPYSIAHLENVWNRYEEELDELDNKNKNINLLRSVAPIFTMASGAIAMISRGTSWGDIVSPLTFMLTALGVVLTVYAVIRAKNFDYKRERNVIQERFENEYVCPNPDCRHFMGNIKYRLLSQNKVCSYCRCKLTH